MKIILIPVNNRPECELALHQGFKLAKKTNSSIIGCHITPHSDYDIPLSSDIRDSFIYSDSYDIAWENSLKKMNNSDDPEQSLLLFEEITHHYGYPQVSQPINFEYALWSKRKGSPKKVFPIIGPTSDLIIISRPIKTGPSIAKTFMFNAILNSSAPVMLLPQESSNSLGNRICIAWNQSQEAMLAVKAALPLLQKANEVNIVTSGVQDKLGPKAKHLQNYLKSWNIDSNHHAINDKSDSEAIMKIYDQTSSDLLVMGCYSRSRLREKALGGVSEYMITETKLPLFTLHL